MLTRHAVIYFFSHGLPGLLTFAGLALYSHLLSPEEYGEYALVLVASGFMNSVVFQWLRLSMLRFLPSDRTEEDSVRTLSTVGLGFFMLVGITGCISLIGFLSVGWRYELGSLWFLATVCGWLQAWFELNLTLLRSKLRPALYGLLMFSKSMLTLLVSVFLLSVWHWKSNGLLLGLLLGVLLSVLWPSIRLWSRPLRLMSFDRILIKKMISYGLPLTISFSLGVVIHYTDRIVLGMWHGSDATGLYSIAFDFSEFSLMTIMMIVNLSAVPIVLRAFEQSGQEAASIQMRKNGVMLVAVAVPSTVGLIVLAPNIVEVCFGQSFESAALYIIPIISVAALLRGMKIYYFDMAFQFYKNTRLQIVPAVCAAVLNVLLNLWWVPNWGIPGSVTATLISYIVACILGYFMGRKLFPIPMPWKEWGKVIMAAACMALLLWPIRTWFGFSPLLIQVALGATIYLIMALILDIAGIRNGFKAAVAGQLRRRHEVSEG